MSAPKVFISYSHDTPEHKDWVRRLAIHLRERGIDAVLDQWDLSPGQDLATFMAGGIRSADRVLLICTDQYVAKADAGSGGVGYERLIVTAEVVGSIDTVKFIPVVRNNSGASKVPHFLGPRVYVDFADDKAYDAKLEELAREIWGAPALIKPSLGENPFKGAVVEASEPVRVVGPSGATASGVPILSDEWFQAQEATASTGLARLKNDLRGAMELRFALHGGLNKTQIELLNAVRVSEIKTFGWPIGVLLENRPEYRPRPFGDGIRAEIAIDDGRMSYDYWAVRKSGDFYLLQSFFEDSRERGFLFFNTRIVRVTEALMFASRLYAELGATADAKISVRVTHTGLSGRTLKPASANRLMHSEPRAHAPTSETETVIALGDILPNLVDEVQRICAPMFMLFDFQEFSPEIYEDIVRRFEKGEAS
ncbi:toll/interleukin-1 receptor domain-containing protein [Bradyrhizobium sp. PMVTL-01]|uniref:toll/interleukin-1 receptor domain-containing protein n=1 Tax=Bradyrhizobium sp. PMVTL-01 TaxID=3434999 RepID=UPI003F70971D